MDLNTNIFVGKGNIAARKDRRIPLFTIETHGQLVDCSDLQKYAGKLAHLFVKTTDGARTSLGRGRLIVTDHCLGVSRDNDASQSGLVTWCVEELVAASKRGQKYEVYLRLLEET